MRYPVGSLYPDYLRTAFGLAVTAGPVFLLDLAGGVAVLLGGLGLLFAWFGSRTMIRQLSRFELSDDALTLMGPKRRRLAWRDLERLRLAYYAPRRSRGDGWLQLTLSGAAGRSIRLDSTLSGFDQVLTHATRAARAKALPLDGATHANLAALGLGGSGVAADGPDASSLTPAPEGVGALGSRTRS